MCSCRSPRGSLGNTGLFLLGGRTRAEPPHAMFIRSGDAMLLSGEARLAYHGVPRVLAGSCPAELATPDPLGRFMSAARININVRQVHAAP